jgi:peptidoglycan/LPS O-acetylase OafA/YrhL
MIQRIQTLWLLFASIAMGLMLKFSFYIGADALTDKSVKITGATSFWNSVLIITFSAITFISIFLFKKRKGQMQLVALAVLIGLVSIFLLYNQTTVLKNGSYSIGAVLPIFAIGFCISAWRCIWQDEKKIKELKSNRLR